MPPPPPPGVAAGTLPPPPPAAAAGPPPLAAPAAGRKAGGSGKKVAAIIASVLALLVIAAVVLVLVFVVLPTDRPRAHELVKSSGLIMDQVQDKGDDMSGSIDELLTNLDTVSSAEDYEQRADEVRLQVEEIKSDIGRARKGYDEILGLDKGVTDYREYAEVVLELLDIDMEQLGSIEEYLDYLGYQFQLAEMGESVDTDAIEETTAAFMSGLNEMGSEADELKDQARKLQTEKKL